MERIILATVGFWDYTQGNISGKWNTGQVLLQKEKNNDKNVLRLKTQL